MWAVRAHGSPPGHKQSAELSVRVYAGHPGWLRTGGGNCKNVGHPARLLGVTGMGWSDDDRRKAWRARFEAGWERYRAERTEGLGAAWRKDEVDGAIADDLERILGPTRGV